MSSFTLTQVLSQRTHYGPHGGLLIDLVLLFQPSSQLFHHLETLITMVSHYHWNGDSHVSLLPIQKRTVWRYKYADFTRGLSLLNSVHWNQVLTVNTGKFGGTSSWKSWGIAFQEVVYVQDKISLGLIRTLSRQSKDVIAYIGNRSALMTLGLHWNTSNFKIRLRLSWDRQSKIISGGWMMLAAETSGNH